MRTSHRLPGYCRRKEQAIVRIGGRVHYLGAWNSEASRRLYDQLLSGWLANGRAGRELRTVTTVRQTAVAYLQEVMPRRRSASTWALRDLLAVCGDMRAEDLRPRDILAVRDRLAKRLTRSTVNEYVRTIKHMLAWGVVRELVPAHVHQAANCIRGLLAGQGGAKEPRVVRPANEADVRATLELLPPGAAAAVRIQLLTGMRSGEVLAMRACDLDMSGETWIYRLVHHKTERLGERVVYLGRQAQEVISPLLRNWPTDRPLIRSNRGQKYTTVAYRNAIGYWAARAGVRDWHPHQLRHSYATMIRARFGLDQARLMLGHRHVAVTEIYAERDQGTAKDIAREVG